MKLPKRGGARLFEVDTYKLSCTPENISSQASIKASEEVGSGIEEFTHVLLGLFDNTRTEVIIKVHDADSGFIDNELKCLNNLNKCKYTAKLLCDFTCLDDKQRWMKPISHNHTQLCEEKGTDNLHFLVMEYIKDGTLDGFMNSLKEYDEQKQNDMIRSLFLQVALAIMEIGITHKVYQGDLNSGNILLYKTSKQYTTYNVGDKKYKVKTNGFYPIIIDFGRGGIYDKKSKYIPFIIDDIIIAIMVMKAWIPNVAIQQKATVLRKKLSEAPRKSVETFIDLIKAF